MPIPLEKEEKKRGLDCYVAEKGGGEEKAAEVNRQRKDGKHGIMQSSPKGREEEKVGTPEWGTLSMTRRWLLKRSGSCRNKGENRYRLRGPRNASSVRGSQGVGASKCPLLWTEKRKKIASIEKERKWEYFSAPRTLKFRFYVGAGSTLLMRERKESRRGPDLSVEKKAADYHRQFKKSRTEECSRSGIMKRRGRGERRERRPLSAVGSGFIMFLDTKKGRKLVMSSRGREKKNTNTEEEEK